MAAMHAGTLVFAGGFLIEQALHPILAAPLIPHDVASRFPLPNPRAQEVRQLAVADGSRVWAATADGVYVLLGSTQTWSKPASAESAAPAFCIAPAFSAPGEVWVGAWNGLYRANSDRLWRAAPFQGPVSAVVEAPKGIVYVGGPDGYFRWDGTSWMALPKGPTTQVSQLALDPEGSLWAATGMGAFQWRGDGAEYVRAPLDQASAAIRGLGWGTDGEQWLATLGGIQIFRGKRWVGLITPDAGLPSADIRRVCHNPNGTWWVATDQGVARKSGKTWSVRRGPRWLPADNARDLVLDAQGAAWIGTDHGVGRIATALMSLEDKAAHFHAILEARHVRPPGIVEKCRLRVAGDTSTWEPMDDDNDGGYTAIAMAMESYRFAATRNPAALAAARRAFAACEFLQRVTGTSGFLARSVVPKDWKEMHDPNEEISPEAWAEQRVNDPRDKRVPVRWRASSDGQWLWKGDTSSDEITAHFFGYYIFHELAADAEDRLRVRQQVCRIVDHLIENGYVLRDLDGQPTRWGVWAPDRLNADPNWAMERGINSVEILSFLKLAYHVSGDAKYADHFLQLYDGHNYRRNVLQAPNLNPAWRTYIDMELLAFAYPALLALEKDAARRGVFLDSFERWHQAIRGDGNPFFEFLYASYRHRRHARLDAAQAFLVDTPLDLVRWSVDNTRREDLRLVRFPEVERWQTSRLLPPSEIGYSRTDQNPWLSQQGEGGLSESDGVFWLLPYWMGRHHRLL
ncbi:MAG: hypothetical protein JNK85_08255 [Verrucomicrobiales bacterium]|nr:hypothetical protein [Verrucomicrobiales bacterium]